MFHQRYVVRGYDNLERLTASTQIRYANQHDYPFLVQNGGNGVGTNFNLTDCGLLLDISRLNHVSFNDDKTEAHIQGGVTVKDLVSAAARNNARVATATCNCLGFLGAALGGGLTRTDGLYGLSVDQLISATVVLASGEIVRTRNTTHPDLWWAIRGAAANFGVVTSAVIKAYPVPAHQNMSWEGSISFSGDKVKQVLEVLSKLKLRPNMQFDFNFLTSGAPSYTPGISIVPFFVGNDSAARAAFAPVLDLGPTNVSVSEVPYNHWNGAGDAFCTKGGRKPGHGASLAHIDVESWISIYRSYEKFIASNRTAFGSSFVLAEIYPLPNTPKHEAATSSYPFRDLPIVVGINPVYSDAALDATAIAWAAEIRSMLWTTAGTAHNSWYVSPFTFNTECNGLTNARFLQLHQLRFWRRISLYHLRRKPSAAATFEEEIRPGKSFQSMVPVDGDDGSSPLLRIR